jgi:hypothetical protein
MQMMHQGDAWRLYVPPALGYRDNRVRIFELHMLGVGEWDMGAVKSDIKSDAKDTIAQMEENYLRKKGGR